MRCTNCGANVLNGAQFCPNCGSSQLVQDYQQQNYQNEGYQQPYQQNGFQQQSMQQVSYIDAPIWLKIISLLFPLAGVIIFFVKKNTEPVYAKSCLIWGLIGFGISFLFGLLF